MARLRRRLGLALLAILLIAIVTVLPGIQRAHASITFKNVILGGENSGATNFQISSLSIAVGDAIIVYLAGEGASCNGPTPTVTDTGGNTYIQKICGGASTHPIIMVYTTISTANVGADVISVTGWGGGAATGQGQALQYTGVSGFGQVGSNQQLSLAAGAHTNTVNMNGLAASSWVTSAFLAETPLATPTVSTTGFIQRTDGGLAASPTFCAIGDHVCPSGDIPATPSITWTWNAGNACNPGLCGADQVDLELTAGNPTSISTLTQCYGNCGTPAITLVNTNSTHTLNFNQSLTILYEFQSNLNGYFNNITVSLAKGYGNNNVGLQLWTTSPASCPLGAIPFQANCPGVGIAGTISQSSVSKGKFSLVFNNGQILTNAGQFYAIGFSAFFSGMDLNDTNTPVQLFQLNGFNPSPMGAGPGVLNSGSKVGLWAWITGLTTTGPGAIPPPTGGNCPGLLDCLIPNWVNSFCFNPTSSCVNGSALIWVGLLALFFSFFTWKGASEIMPNVRIPVGEIFLVWILIWTFAITGIGLLFVWVPILIFFVVALMFGKHTGTFL